MYIYIYIYIRIYIIYNISSIFNKEIDIINIVIS